jgi:hypothetical protein
MSVSQICNKLHSGDKTNVSLTNSALKAIITPLFTTLNICRVFFTHRTVGGAPPWAPRPARKCNLGFYFRRNQFIYTHYSHILKIRKVINIDGAILIGQPMLIKHAKNKIVINTRVPRQTHANLNRPTAIYIKCILNTTFYSHLNKPRKYLSPEWGGGWRSAGVLNNIQHIIQHPGC